MLNDYVETDLTYICKPLNVSLYLTFGQHVVNCFVALICLAGIESKICFSNLFCGFIIYEFSMLIYLQIAYFNSMTDNCLQLLPMTYLWAALQTLTLYIGLIVLLCYFARKVC